MLDLLIADSSYPICSEIEEFCAGLTTIRVLKSVHNGEEVINAMQTDQPNILLIDIVLPVLDGLGALEKIQKMNLYPHPYIFVHTAFLDNRILQELQRLDVMYCFLKPTNPEHIVSRMLQLLQTSFSPEDASKKALNILSQDTPGIVSPPFQNKPLNEEITREIRAVGMPAHLRGYHYLRTAIHYSAEAEDPSTIAITKDIYPYIAELYNTRPQLVERAIRNAIEVTWTRGNTKILHQYFGYTIDDYKGKPTNAEFIAMIADRVRIAMQSK